MSFIEVEIMGRVFRLQGDQPDRIRAFADIVNAHVARIQNRFDVIDSGKVLGLVAMNVAEAYYDADRENQVLKAEIDRLRERLEWFMAEYGI
jgi:cell division protein ZapA (FtsZ GTPase activity inhibitor)